MGDIVLVAGDPLLVEAALLEERATALGDLDATWALTEVEGGSRFGEDLAATAMLGLGDERRVVVVRRAGGLDDASWEQLIGYVAAVPEHVSLVIEGLAWTVPVRAKALADKVRGAGGRVRREDVPPPGKRADFVRVRAEARGIRVEARAARYLAQYLGDEIGNLPGVLDQLVAVHGEAARLDEDDVASLFQGARHGAQWDLTDAIDRGDAALALDYVHGAFDTWHPFPIHASLVTHYRRILAVAGRNLTPAEAGEELGMKEFPARKVVEQANRLGVEGARRAYELLADTDVILRGGGGEGPALDDRAVIDLLVVQLCGLVNAAGRAGVSSRRR